MEKKFETVIYEKLDDVARITLNRPEVRNAQNVQMTRDIDAAFREGEADDEVKVIILAGTGPHFSAGHDLGSPQAKAERANTPTKPGQEGRMNRELDIYLGMCMRWRDIPKPTIAQVQGACITGGAMLAATCDIIVASEDAYFNDLSVRQGVGALEYFFHSWDLGARRAKLWLFTGDNLTAQEALQAGFVSKVVPRAQLEEETMKLAKRIALGSAFSLQLAKLTVNETLDIMGFKTAANNAFKAHQIAHGHHAELGSGGLSIPRPEGMSIADWAKIRDKAYGG